MGFSRQEYWSRVPLHSLRHRYREIHIQSPFFHHSQFTRMLCELFPTPSPGKVMHCYLHSASLSTLHTNSFVFWTSRDKFAAAGARILRPERLELEFQFCLSLAGCVTWGNTHEPSEPELWPSTGAHTNSLINK